jgi:CheY-like chemotaxis protein
MMTQDRPASSTGSSPDNRPDVIVPWVVEFRIVGTPHIIRAPMSDTLLIGRRDEERGILPAVDLTDYNALEKGVSRRHAQLEARDNRVIVKDLGSNNGTYLNNIQLDVLRPKRLYSGDRLRLGKLELQVQIVVKPSVHDSTLHGLGNDITIAKIASGQRLLVLDESRDVCRVMRYVAEQSGFEVAVRHTVRDAIAYLDANAVDGLIVELLLPDGSGLDVMTYLQKQQGSVPMMVTGATGMERALENGAELFLTRPLAVDELAIGLKKMVRLMDTLDDTQPPGQASS